MKTNGTEPAPPTGTKRIVGVGCDGGQYYVETLPPRTDGYPHTGYVNVEANVAKAITFDAKMDENVKASRERTKRDWWIGFVRPTEIDAEEWAGLVEELADYRQTMDDASPRSQ